MTDFVRSGNLGCHKGGGGGGGGGKIFYFFL